MPCGLAHCLRFTSFAVTKYADQNQLMGEKVYVSSLSHREVTGVVA